MLTVDLWLLWFADKEDRIPRDVLSQKERNRSARYRQEQKRTQFERAHCCGRWIVSKYLDCGPEDVCWSESGAPRVNAPRAPETHGISFSHSGHLLALAIAPATVQMGVDIEETEHSLPRHALVTSALRPDERTWWESLPEEDKDATLWQVWTIKEAVIKSVGQSGLRPLGDVRISPRDLNETGKESFAVELVGDNGNSPLPLFSFASANHQRAAICDITTGSLDNDWPAFCGSLILAPNKQAARQTGLLRPVCHIAKRETVLLPNAKFASLRQQWTHWGVRSLVLQTTWQ